MPGRKQRSKPAIVAPAGTQSIQRVVRILRELASRNREGARLADLVASLELEQPTVHRMLKSLVAESVVTQDAESKRYFLGPTLYELGLVARVQFDLGAICGPFVASLARATGDTVFLIIPSGDDSLCIDRREGDFPVKLHTVTIGDRRPLGIGASGIALLSAFPEAEIRRVLDYQEEHLEQHSEPSKSALLKRVLEAKRIGYAVRDLPKYEGIRSVGMPVLDANGQPVAALSVSTLAARLSGEQFNKRLALLKQEVALTEQSIASNGVQSR